MHCHCGTNNRAPRWTFTDPCKTKVRPGAQEESASPAWLAAPAMNARDTCIRRYGGVTLDVDRHYFGSVTATTHQEKGIITLESNPSRGTVLPAPHGKGNKCDKNVKMHIRLYGSCGNELGRSIAEVTDNILAIGVVKPVYKRSSFPLTATAV